MIWVSQGTNVDLATHRQQSGGPAPAKRPVPQTTKRLYKGEDFGSGLLSILTVAEGREGPINSR